MRKQVILITQSFPYKPGEEFLETEIIYYENYKNIRFIVLPARSKEEKRNVNSAVKVDEYLIKYFKSLKYNRYTNFLRNIFNKYFYIELFYNNLFSLKKLKQYNESMTMYYSYLDAFDNYLGKCQDITNTVIYTYWNTEATYALQSLKSKYGYKLISRIHGFDIYKERKTENYMPLKKQFTKNIDMIYTITESANKYLIETYNFSHKSLALSRLGVEDHHIESLANEKDVFHIVSCSFLSENKKIQKIIEALKYLGEETAGVSYYWTHIGDGKEYDNLLKMSNYLLKDIANVKFKFLGNLTNLEVYNFYKTNKVDVFVNVSMSEGVPVSIMEAMSCHIPIVAPNVGGISDMVKLNQNGFLLSDKCKIRELVNALKQHDYLKKLEVRNASYKIFLDKYNAQKNYTEFLDAVTKL